MTMLDRRVAQIYVSTDSRKHGNTYNSYVLAMMEKYGIMKEEEVLGVLSGVTKKATVGARR